jgi:hypothetical protein
MGESSPSAAVLLELQNLRGDIATLQLQKANVQDLQNEIRRLEDLVKSSQAHKDSE